MHQNIPCQDCEQNPNHKPSDLESPGRINRYGRRLIHLVPALKFGETVYQTICGKHVKIIKKN